MATPSPPPPSPSCRVHTWRYDVQPTEIRAALYGVDRNVCIVMVEPFDVPFRIEEVVEDRTGPRLHLTWKEDDSESGNECDDFGYEITDLASVFESTGFHAADGGMQCVVQRRSGGGVRSQKVTGFNAGRVDSVQRELWRRVADLPTELKENVFKYMDYDQVAWLADTDERFARSLASHRYGVRRAHDKTAYPDLRSVIVTVRHTAVDEMRFDVDDDLWMAPLYCGSTPRPGLCRRYPVEPGLYRWYKAAATTKVRFDERTAFGTDGTSMSCPDCIGFLEAARRSMYTNQRETVAGRSRLKMFVLKGSGNVRPSTCDAAPHTVGGPGGHDAAVHVWTDRRNDPWLSKLRWGCDGEKGLVRYLESKGFSTLLFKDPLKFFHTVKTIVPVDDDVDALVSDADGQAVGYLVRDGNCTFRIPVQTAARRTGEAVRFVGLEFLPSAFNAELNDVSVLLQHLYCHRVETECRSARLRVQRLADMQVNDPENFELLDNVMVAALRKFQRLKRILERGCTLESTGLHSRRTNGGDDIEFQEWFNGGYVVCTAYAFETLGSSRRQACVKRAYDFVRRSYGFESDFALGVIDEIVLKATLSVALQRVAA